jgi:hypothetical protein
MKKHGTLKLALGLILLSVLLHIGHYLVFNDLHHLLIYLCGDIAFIPLEVFFVSLVLDKFIEKREKEKQLNKANMMIGLFYQELGGRLLASLAYYDKALDERKTEIKARWTKKEYGKVQTYLASQKLCLNLDGVDYYGEFHEMINEKQTLIINLLTNQALQENEQFTEALMSVFHLLEELSSRKSREWIEEDWNHLKMDMERVYKNLALGWVHYLVYLKDSYPYLYASAIRDNPFAHKKGELLPNSK